MVKNGGRTEFMVRFYDGERETDMGKVPIKPQLEYKPFQLMLAKRIGISPNQMSIYLLDLKQTPQSPFSEVRRRIPVTHNTNFHHVRHLKGCCFLVILKQRSTKRINRRVSKINGVEGQGILRDPVYMVPEKMAMVWRNHMAPLKMDDMNRHVRSLKVEEREIYPAIMSNGNVALGPRLNFNLSPTVIRCCRSDSTPSPVNVNVRRTDLQAFCRDCWNGEKHQLTTSFHPCVNDTVISGFCPQFGPINRPKKSHV